MFYKTNHTFEKLNQNKQQYEGPAYMHSDFRGLLNADFVDAVQNCHQYDA
jgi:hypothetical protein